MVEPGSVLDGVGPEPCLFTTVLSCFCFAQTHSLLRGRRRWGYFLCVSSFQSAVYYGAAIQRPTVWRGSQKYMDSKGPMSPFRSAEQGLKGESLGSSVTLLSRSGVLSDGQRESFT